MTAETHPPGAGVGSPCVGICCIGTDGLCIGCYRSRAELAAWFTATDAEKREIRERCRQRSLQHQP